MPKVITFLEQQQFDASGCILSLQKAIAAVDARAESNKRQTTITDMFSSLSSSSSVSSHGPVPIDVIDAS